jgi:hypothetical protein
MCVYVYLCTYVCMCVYDLVSWLLLGTCCVRECVCTHICTYAYLPFETFSLNKVMSVCWYTCVCACVYTHTCMCMHIRLRIFFFAQCMCVRWYVCAYVHGCGQRQTRQEEIRQGSRLDGWGVHCWSPFQKKSGLFVCW